MRKREYQIKVVKEEVRRYNEISNLIRTNFVRIKNEDIDKINNVLLKSKVFDYLQSSNINSSKFVIELINIYTLLNWFRTILSKNDIKDVNQNVQNMINELVFPSLTDTEDKNQLE